MDSSPGDTDVNQRIGRRVRALRAQHEHTLDGLARHSGVSRSMISLIERGEASPTAAVLDRLAAGLGVSLASLFDDSPAGPDALPVVRRAQQAIWRDPESGYLRRNLSPPGWASPLQLVEVHFPPQARVAYESHGREQAQHQQIWVLEGRIDVRLGDEQHALASGDCLALRLDRPLIYSNPHTRAARYLVAICTEPRLTARP